MVKISIIVPFYNTASMADRCLQSVFGQDFEDFECIAVDDCSTDNTMQVVEQYTDSRLRIIRHEYNRGLSAARNSGLEVAEGEWIFFLDSDDVLPAGALSSLIEATDEQTQWVQGAFNRISAERRWQTIYPEAHYHNHEQIAAHYDQLNFTNATNKLIRTDFCRRLQFTEGLIFEDSLWCAEAYMMVENIRVIETPTYDHHIREGSIMQSSFSQHKIDSLLYIVQMIIYLQPDRNLQQTAIFNALYLIKNLYCGNFDHRYRRTVMEQLRATDVLILPIERHRLPPFTKFMSYGRRLPDCWFWLCCRLYTSLRKLTLK